MDRMKNAVKRPPAHYYKRRGIGPKRKVWGRNLCRGSKKEEERFGSKPLEKRTRQKTPACRMGTEDEPHRG